MLIKLNTKAVWPELNYSLWKETYATLHMWCQILGKYKLKLAPFVNHWWHTSLAISTRGLTTGPIPYPQHNETFELELDFIAHRLALRSSTGIEESIALQNGKSVAAFHNELSRLLVSNGINVPINLTPKEVPNPINFDQDETHKTYNKEFAFNHWRILLHTDRIFKKFRGDFIGKASPVQFFWGSFDLTTSRFSGRVAPPREGADNMTLEGYSHEVMSVGFWPGSGNIEEAAFYAYAAPEPKEFSTTTIQPRAAFYNAPTKGFVLRYNDVRKAENPEQMILDFCESAYLAAATLGNWDRKALERNKSLTIPENQKAS